MAIPMSERHAHTLEEAGFSEAQVDALLAVFTVHHHSHSIDEVIGLEEHLEELGEDCEDDGPDDDE